MEYYHVIIDKKYKQPLQKVAKQKKMKMNALLESIIESNPEIKEELKHG